MGSPHPVREWNRLFDFGSPSRSHGLLLNTKLRVQSLVEVDDLVECDSSVRAALLFQTIVFRVHAVVKLVLRRYRTFAEFIEHTAYLVFEHLFVDAHEIASQVEFEYVTFAFVVVRTTPYIALQTFYAEKSAFVFAARVTVFYERSFAHSQHISENQVMHHTVAEIGREYLAFHWFGNYEADALAGGVTSFYYLPVELHDVVLHIHFEL